MIRVGKTKPPVPSEAEILRSILAVLKFHGVRAWRQNTGAFGGEYKGRKRFVRFGEKGQADIYGALPGGRCIAVEVKKPGNKPTPEQIQWLASVNEVGGFAFWATSAQTVDHAVRAVLLNPGLRVEMGADGSMDLTDEGTSS